MENAKHRQKNMHANLGNVANIGVADYGGINMRYHEAFGSCLGGITKIFNICQLKSF